MKTIRAIFRAGNLTPLDPLDLPENTPLTLAVLEGDDLSIAGIVQTAQNGGAFDFLNDPREDVYSSSDGEAVS